MTTSQARAWLVVVVTLVHSLQDVLVKAERSLLAILAMSLAAGCYEYDTVAASQPSVGTQLRISLSDDGTVGLRPLLGPSAEQLEGRVQQSDDSSITLGVTELVRRNGVPESWNGESVRIVRSQIARQEQRRFSPVHTAILAGILVGGTAVAAVATRSGDGTVAVPVQGPPQPGH